MDYFEYVPAPLSAGGVGLYIKESLSYTEYLKTHLMHLFRLYGAN